MFFCMSCGKSIPSDAKFCPYCGKLISDNSENLGIRRQVYDGVVHKCPNCGEVLSSFMTTCPTCGYEIRGVDASGIVKEFADKLSKLEESKQTTKKGRRRREIDKQKIDLIQNFLIPTTKEDVLEFLSLALGNIDSSVLTRSHSSTIEYAISQAWLAKLEQAYAKAIILFGNDPSFKNIQTIYQNKKEAIKQAQKSESRSIIIAFLISVAPLIILSIVLGLVEIFKK